MRSAMPVASLASAMFSMRMANSSPPMRATRSAGADAAAQAIGGGAQQLVAGDVAEAVVDELEAIEVEEEDREVVDVLARIHGDGVIEPV